MSANVTTALAISLLSSRNSVTTEIQIAAQNSNIYIPGQNF